MLCPHCCFAATAKGTDMSRETFVQAMELTERLGEYVTLGGGEPTINKHCLDMVQYAAERHRKGGLELPPLIITNGKMHGKAHKLLDMVERGIPLQVELSQDEWHDPIHEDVIRRFKALTGTHGDAALVDIRTVKHIGPWGRAADPARGIPISKHMGSCVCDSMTVDPDGVIWSCGCKIHQLGNVADADLDLSWFESEYAHTGGRNPDELQSAA